MAHSVLEATGAQGSPGESDLPHLTVVFMAHYVFSVRCEELKVEQLAFQGRHFTTTTTSRTSRTGLQIFKRA